MADAGFAAGLEHAEAVRGLRADDLIVAAVYAFTLFWDRAHAADADRSDRLGAYVDAYLEAYALLAAPAAAR